MVPKTPTKTSPLKPVVCSTPQGSKAISKSTDLPRTPPSSPDGTVSSPYILGHFSDSQSPSSKRSTDSISPSPVKSETTAPIKRAASSYPVTPLSLKRRRLNPSFFACQRVYQQANKNEYITKALETLAGRHNSVIC